jgi:hypothetical protein
MKYVLANPYGRAIEVDHKDIISFESYDGGTFLILNKNNNGLCMQSIAMSFEAFTRLYNS